MEPFVEIKNLKIGFLEENGPKEVVKDMNFSICPGEIVGVVGESGSGKSMSALALMGLLPKKAKILEGQILLEGQNLLSVRKDELRKIQGKEIGMVFQEPMTSLNPVMKIEKQVGECLELHTDYSEKEIHKKVVDALHLVGLAEAEKICSKYPHELSGGMRQRVMIAQAMVSSPKLLIADEPTTALDVMIQAQILRLLKRINQEQNTAIFFISHDLNVIKEICDRVLVMYKGHIVEEGNTEEVLLNPKHDYTKSLVASIPDVEEIEENTKEVLKLSHLDVYYECRSGIFRRKATKKHVIHDLDLVAYDREILGIVGESGCGKSTLCKTILGLNQDYTGTIQMTENLKPQMVFQDPFSSLNPARKIGWILEEPLKLRGISDSKKRKKMVSDMLEDVGLDSSYAGRYARELSGGQRQRISIGAALLMDSKFVIADEPVSALDVTVQSQILKLLLRLHKERQMTLLFISHDLNIIRHICHRVAVLYLGEIVEMGSVKEVYYAPSHPYTRLLLESVSDGNSKIGVKEVTDIGEVSHRNSPGCPFYSRCPEKTELCKNRKPEVRKLDENQKAGTHYVKCWNDNKAENRAWDGKEL